MFQWFRWGRQPRPLAAVSFLQAEEEKLIRLRAEIQSLNQAKNRFLSAVSHDLRQPFQAMGLFLHLLQNRLTTPEQQELAGKVRDSLREGESLLGSILDFVALDMKNIQPNIRVFSLRETIERVVQEMEPNARAKGLRLSIFCPAHDVKTDSILLEKLLRQLLRNAIAYTDKGKILVGCRRRENLLTVMVCDTGRGIPESKQAVIFEEFYQIDNTQRDRSKGFGLGLAMVDRIAKLLGLRVEVRSQTGRGSVFYFHIPYIHSAAQHVAVSEGGAAAPLKGRRVAVLEDDPLQLMALRLMLQDWGCQVTAASQGGALLDMLTSQKEKPELVLSDFRLPDGITGLDVLETIRTDFGHAIPGIILTGDAETNLTNDLGAQRVLVLSKPIQPQTLQMALKEILG